MLVPEVLSLASPCCCLAPIGIQVARFARRATRSARLPGSRVTTHATPPIANIPSGQASVQIGNIVKEITKPSAPRKRAVVPLTPAAVERIRRAMLLADPERGLRDATIVSILGYTGMRPEEVLALECDHPKEKTILVEQKVSLGVIYKSQKVKGRPPRSPRLFSAVRADIRAYQLAEALPHSTARRNMLCSIPSTARIVPALTPSSSSSATYS